MPKQGERRKRTLKKYKPVLVDEFELVLPIPTKISDISAPTVAAYGKAIHAMRPMEVILRVRL